MIEALKQDALDLFNLFKGASSWPERFGIPAKGMTGLKVRHEKQLYNQPEQFKQVLEFRYFLGEYGCFMSADKHLYGMVFEVGLANTHGKTEDYAITKRDQITNALRNIPRHFDHPYVLQTFCQDESLESFIDDVAAYQSQFGEPSAYRDEYLKMWGTHYKNLSRKGGYFKNPTTGIRWGGIQRKVRFVLYRNMVHYDKDLFDSPEEEISGITHAVMTALATDGIQTRLYHPGDVYDWLVPWFNPQPEGEESGTTMVRKYPLPYTPGEDYYGLDDQLFKYYPYFDVENRCVHFNDSIHSTIVGIERQHQNPPIGVWTTSTNDEGSRLGTAMERLPEGCVVGSTTVFKPALEVEDRMNKVDKDSKGGDERQQKTRREISDSKLAMDQNNALYPSFSYVYVQGDSLSDLKKNRGKTMSILRSLRFDPIELNADLVPIDTYTKYLPFSYKPHYDGHMYRNRLQWDKLMVNMIPMYGASTGTGNHGMLFLTPEGMPFTFDPLNKEDKEQNSNIGILSPPGSGKSATVNQLIASAKATHNPFFIVIDVNGSFRLHHDYFAEKGYKTRYMELSMNSDLSLPLFDMAIPVYLEELAKGEGGMDDDSEYVLFDEDLSKAESEKNDDQDEERDPMGEMVLTAKMMVTKGMTSAEAEFKSNDYNMLNNAILMAAEAVHHGGGKLVRPIDVVNALWRISDTGVMFGHERKYRQDRRDRASDMAESMVDYTTGAKGQFFNRHGESWPACDFLVLDLKMLSKTGYEDILYLTYIGLMNYINTLIEKRRGKGRQTVVINDEAHIINMIRILAMFKRKSIKMWRKNGCWLWDSTQNVKDYPDEAIDILNVMEWLILLKMPRAEIEALKKFKDISIEEESMLNSLTIDKGKYAEGLVLSNKVRSTFRSVPPPWYLVVGQTEEDEYAERLKLMEDFNITEIEAAHRIADEVEAKRCTAKVT